MTSRLAKCAMALGFMSFAIAADTPAVPSGRMVWIVQKDANGRLVRRLVPGALPALSASEGLQKPKAKSKKTVSTEIKDIVELAADRHGVDPLLVHSVISVESNYNPLALSPKGAQGLMQLIPSTAKRFGAQNSFDSRENIEAGVKYLKHLQGLYHDDLSLTLAAYNAGEGAVAKYKNGIPPYRETVDYVKKVGERYEEARRQKPEDTKASRANAAAAAAVVPAPIEEFRHIEAMVDDQGRLYVRTR